MKKLDVNRLKKVLTGVGRPSVRLHPDRLLSKVLVHNVHPAFPVVVSLVYGGLPLAIVLCPAQDGHGGGQDHHVFLLLPCRKTEKGGLCTRKEFKNLRSHTGNIWESKSLS